ncbi:hypothetical protein HGA34_03520 [Candidatus Falkowbacteria bacterium]|nr:hypothetical protein [Candidatus Falkowbacteria bacterium]
MAFKEKMYQPFNGETPKISRRGFLVAGLGALALLAGKRTHEAFSNPEEGQALAKQINELQEGLTGKTLELNDFLSDEETSEEDKQQIQIALKLFESFSLNLTVVDVMNRKLQSVKESGDKETEEEIARQMVPYLDKLNQFMSLSEGEDEGEQEPDTERKKITI